MNNDEQSECFDRWLSEHTPLLHHVANGFAEGADRQDLMQELLLALWRAIPAFRQVARPSTFIYGVAHNTALMWKRKERNYRQKLDRFESLATIKTDAIPDPSGREAEALDALYAEIRKLPPVDRSLALLLLDDLSYAEIAKIHGMTESNVGARLSRLKQKLTHNMKGIVHELR